MTAHRATSTQIATRARAVARSRAAEVMGERATATARAARHETPSTGEATIAVTTGGGSVGADPPVTVNTGVAERPVRIAGSSGRGRTSRMETVRAARNTATGGIVIRGRATVISAT